MSYDALQDLTMAGVVWEITDLPSVFAANNIAKPADGNPTPKKDTAGPSGRVATTVVPPITPIQPMSIEIARAMAARPADMPSLLRMISEFNHPLRAGATNVVLPHAAANTGGLVIISDIPGSEDDASGNILSGNAGELMDKMLAAIGMSRDVVSIIPMLFWRTPGGRTPSHEELELSRPFVDRAIEILSPRVILTLGALPATEIGGVSLANSMGKIINSDAGYCIVPIYHPNYLLLKPAAKRDTWIALQAVQNMLKTA